MIARVVIDLIQLYIVILIVRAVLTWFPTEPGSGVDRLGRSLDKVTEPVLAPVRRILPPMRMGGMGIDLSIIVVLLVLELLVIPVVARVL
ncbi:MAG: YggT family protein [Acidimicrobiales bacterium]|nr:YggT family protein [Actinomycetota bacterium]MDA8184684.1 YggT family protein [Actinomycetota bacterium]